MFPLFDKNINRRPVQFLIKLARTILHTMRSRKELCPPLNNSLGASIRANHGLKKTYHPGDLNQPTREDAMSPPVQHEARPRPNIGQQLVLQLTRSHR